MCCHITYVILLASSFLQVLFPPFENTHTHTHTHTTGGNPGEIFPSSAISDQHHPKGIDGENSSADELLGEVPGENLMEEKTADQGGR